MSIVIPVNIQKGYNTQHKQLAFTAKSKIRIKTLTLESRQHWNGTTELDEYDFGNK